MVFWLQVEKNHGHFITTHSAPELALLIQRHQLARRARCIVMVEQGWHRSLYQLKLLKYVMNFLAEIYRCRRMIERKPLPQPPPPPRTAYNEDSPSSSSYASLTDDEPEESDEAPNEQVGPHWPDTDDGF